MKKPSPPDRPKEKSSQNVRLVFDRDIYTTVVLEAVGRASRFLWIGTSDMKDLYVEKNRRMAPFLEVLSDLAHKGVELRLIHAKEPGPAFRRDFDRYPALVNGLERILCPRVHFKSVIVDGEFAYTGSANLTGAGMGAKGSARRNFETGVVTTDKALIDQLMDQFDGVWMGKHCGGCGRRSYCADFRDLL
jgi:phosphatidylserine/phosphatidylglycerophosphate/cardiolipin synthase-like enzyme